MSIGCKFSPARREIAPLACLTGSRRRHQDAESKHFAISKFERILRSKPDGGKDGSDGIMAGPSWAKAIGVRGQFRFPFRFQGLAHERLPCPVRLGWNAQWALFRP